MFKKKHIFLVIALLVIPFVSLAFELPDGSKPWTSQTIIDLIDNIADFLIWAGVVGGIITIVYAGIVFFTHGFNAKAVENAKGILKNAIYGVAIVVGFGVIINTVAAIITGDFWGGGNNEPEITVGPGDEGVVTVSTGTLGQPCNTDNSCNSSGWKCNSYSAGVSICVRKDVGNRKTENCWGGKDCQEGLVCDGAIIDNVRGNYVMGTCQN